MKPNIAAYVPSLSLHDNVPMDITPGTHFYAFCRSSQPCLTGKCKFLLVKFWKRYRDQHNWLSPMDCMNAKRFPYFYI